MPAPSSLSALASVASLVSIRFHASAATVAMATDSVWSVVFPLRASVRMSSIIAFIRSVDRPTRERRVRMRRGVARPANRKSRRRSRARRRVASPPRCRSSTPGRGRSSRDVALPPGPEVREQRRHERSRSSNLAKRVSMGRYGHLAHRSASLLDVLIDQFE